MEDVELARKAAAQAKVVPVGAGATARVIEADENRLSVSFSSDGTQTIWIQPENVPSATLTGFTLTPTNPVLRMTLYDYGDVICRPFTAFGGAGNANLTVTTMSLKKR